MQNLQGWAQMVLYFSYGSNMNQVDMNRFCKEVGRPLIDLKTKSPRIGILKDFKLDFNYNSISLGGGAANIEPSSGDHVEGVVFDMTEEEMKTLDLKEGHPSDFPRVIVTITLLDGTELKNVVAYHAHEDKKTDFTPPSKAYKQVIVDGAKAFGLSKEWVQRLEALPTQPA